MYTPRAGFHSSVMEQFSRWTIEQRLSDWLQTREFIVHGALPVALYPAKQQA